MYSITKIAYEKSLTKETQEKRPNQRILQFRWQIVYVIQKLITKRQDQTLGTKQSDRKLQTIFTLEKNERTGRLNIKMPWYRVEYVFDIDRRKNSKNVHLSLLIGIARREPIMYCYIFITYRIWPSSFGLVRGLQLLNSSNFIPMINVEIINN